MIQDERIRRLTKNEGAVSCPFAVQIDTREQLPYMFSTMRTNQKEGSKLIEVPLEFKSLPEGDYSIVGMADRIVIERKSKEDLYSSVVRRDNFKGRLERMSKIAASGGYAAVVVECEVSDLSNRPNHSRLCAKSLNRTILAWRQRYRVDWWFLSGRHTAEAYTFRMLERFWLDHHKDTSGENNATIA